MAESESASLLKKSSGDIAYGTSASKLVSATASTFETVDWEFGAERDRLLREALQKSRQMRHRSRSKWRRILSDSLTAGEGWFVFLIVGFFTGLLAGMIQVSREWAFDLKFGYCSEGGFWNSRKECCRISKDEDSCWQWRTWSEFLMGLPGSGKRDRGYGLDYLLYMLWCTVLGTWSAWLVKTFAPFASGSGIPEIKTILGGFVMKGYLGGRVLLIKSVALVLSVASGLSVGLEAAYVHIACCVANVSSRYFSKYATSEVKKRELLSGAAAAGISVAFGAPVGGVLFSLEMLSSYFPPKTIWRSFYCAIVAAITLRGIDPLHSGKLVAFEITYHYAFGWFELPIFVMLGAIGGLLGTLLLKLMVRYAYLRQTTRIARHPLYEAAVVSFLSASATYLSTFLRMDTTDLLAALYSDCKYETNATLCVESDASNIIIFLLACALIKFILTIFGPNTIVPGGHMVPSMAVGACLGRVFGFCLSLVQERVGDVGFFAECAGHDPCITPGVYAIIGSAAMLSAVSRMTVSLVVIIFELTDGIDYIMPTTICILVAKWVSDAFGRDGIYDELIILHDYPYLNNKMEFVFNETAADVMKSRDLCVINATGNTYGSIANLLNTTEFSGYPIVKSMDSMQLIGYISRANLETVLNAKTPDMTDATQCFFTNDRPFPRNAPYLDFNPWLDQSPIQIVETTPLNRVIDAFRALRLRYVLVVRNGALVGITTKRDILRRIHTFRGTHKFASVNVKRS
ncbi:hypothetical protein GUITHDRAFT_113947 [Guillardia theta CCMP2712]|uniref:Chloride channel protein n=1 Tax=Guillardia theta (strain CCMP2712) TaxID=905079 RepID=L1IVT6_GUITC|nr:hypothetical protein GUITHDRAFT_113947 [Guillardia theta CCMP2712]EKX39955.1 hypothetical protein GUITHDRAFT_113947 [Guillardia theta CCMP2712]|eukprot:XP_005826935.1 hypothetical protein GUITHDRAFT_113947 [Guillardia theta CCMP2712]